MIQQLLQVCFMLFNNFASAEVIGSFRTYAIERVITLLNGLTKLLQKNSLSIQIFLT